MTIKQIYQSALDSFGSFKQLSMLVEECSELIHAIQQFKRLIGGPRRVIEEIVDVEIMLGQIKLYFFTLDPKYKKDYMSIKLQKLNRLSHRIEEYNNVDQ